MDPIGAIGSAVGGLASSAIGMYEAQENRNFQQQMSDTAIQRRVTDLKKAGINPILAGGQIGGASTPTGAMPSMPDLSNVGQSYNSAKANSIQQQLASANIAKTQADTRTSNANAHLAESMANYSDSLAASSATSAQADSLKKEWETTPDWQKAQLLQLQSSAKASALELPTMQNAAGAADSWFGKNIMPYLQSALHTSQVLRNVAP